MASNEISLPDCSNVVIKNEQALLNGEGIDLLIKKIAKEGVGAIDKGIQELEQSSSSVAENIKALRAKLVEQIQNSIKLLQTKYEKEKINIAKSYEMDTNLIWKQRKELESYYNNEYDLGKASSYFDINDLITILVPENQKRVKMTIIERIVNAFKRLIRRIIDFFANIFKKKENAKKKKIGIASFMGIPTSKIVDIAMSDSVIGSKIMSEISYEKNIPKVKLEEVKKKDTGRYRKEVEEFIKRKAETIDKNKFDLKAKRIVRKKIDKLIEKDEALNREKNRKMVENESLKEMAQKKVEKDMMNNVDREVRNNVLNEFKSKGYIKGDISGKIEITTAFINRMGEIIFEEEMHKIQQDSSKRTLYSTGFQSGVYGKRRIVSKDELAKIDIMDSIIESRVHGFESIDEDLSYVYNEIGERRVHSILLFDKSGSMEEGDKLYAAKRALAAMYVTIKKHSPQSIVDIVAFDSKVKILDFYEMWNAEPGDFTNTGEALLTAFRLFSRGNVQRDLYLITDGLPEAYTTKAGDVKAGDLPKSLVYALESSRLLSTLKNLSFTVVLLRSEDKRYLEAAKMISNTCRGKVIVTEPKTLATTLLLDYSKKIGYSYNS